MTSNNKVRPVTGQIDPDPMSVFLIWLGAVGSLSSIVGLFYKPGERQRSHRLSDRKRVEFITTATELRHDVNRLDDEIERIALFLSVAQATTVNAVPLMEPRDLGDLQFRFGAVQLNLPIRELREWARITGSMASVANRAGRGVHNLLILAASTGVTLDPVAEERLYKLRITLNSVVTAKTFEQAIEQCRDAGKLGRAVTEEITSQIISGFDG